MDKKAAGAVQGIGGEIGTITKVFSSDGGETVDRVWVLLDNFKHPIKDPLIADWKAKLEIPTPSRVVRLASCDSSGVDAPAPEECCPDCGLRRLDFQCVPGRPDVVKDVHIVFKDCLKEGDRVMVIPFNGGQDHLILCKLTSSKGGG